MTGFNNILVFGATSAICHSILKHFTLDQNEKPTLFLAARSEQKLTAAAEDLSARGATIAGQALYDFCDYQQHATTMRAAVEAMGAIDLILVAHGTLPDQQRCEQELQAALAAIDENLSSTVSILIPAAQLLEEQGRGALAVISSVAADRGRKTNYVYAASKSAVDTLLEGFRGRFAGTDITVTTIKPGLIDSPMTSDFDKGALWASTETIAPAICKAISKGKSTVYVPGFWRLIMLIIRLLPGKILYRLSI